MSYVVETIEEQALVQRSVSAREANQQFSRILRDVQAGTEVLVTRRGGGKFNRDELHDEIFGLR